MTELAILAGAAILSGIGAKFLRLPPLIGFLVAGFLLGIGGMPQVDWLEPLANLGVTLLLFTIGLKFNARALLRAEVWATSTIHLVVMTLIGAGTAGLFATILSIPFGWPVEALILGFAFSFSSTVVCVKLLDDRGESTSLYGQIAIGILLVQDLAAVVFMSVASGEPPSPWSFALLLLIPASWALRRIMDAIGHGELLVLFGVAVALVPGYFLFDLVGLKGDLGAIFVGVLLASHPKAHDLADELFAMKELFLVAFFLSIGFNGLPSPNDAAFAVFLVVVLVPLNAIVYSILGRMFGLRNRTSAKSGFLLANFSEFGIIVVAVCVDLGLLTSHWLLATAVAVAFSMILSVLLNGPGSELANAMAELLPKRDPQQLKEHDRPIDVSHVDALVIGMGRIGEAAYDRLDEDGVIPLGLERDTVHVGDLHERHYDVLAADATDPEFWIRVLGLGHVEVALLAMPDHGSNRFTYEMLRQQGFTGRVVAVVRFPDQADELLRLGVDDVLHLYQGAGAELADRALVAIDDEH